MERLEGGKLEAQLRLTSRQREVWTLNSVYSWAPEAQSLHVPPELVCPGFERTPKDTLPIFFSLRGSPAFCPAQALCQGNFPTPRHHSRSKQTPLPQPLVTF